MIRLDSIRKVRRGRVILDGVDLTARPGRVTAFLGPNGAGKSSTLRILLGLDHADGGSALIGALPYRALRDPLRTVGAALDGSGAHVSRTGRDHLAWVARTNGISLLRVDEVLAAVELTDAARARVGTYSLGMGQRLGIAAALLGDPPVLVLDEPANGLDPQGIRWLRELLRARAEAGGTVLLSSHLIREVAGLADDLVVIAAGRTVAQGPTADVAAGHHTLEDAFFALTAGEAR